MPTGVRTLSPNNEKHQSLNDAWQSNRYKIYVPSIRTDGNENVTNKCDDPSTPRGVPSGCVCVCRFHCLTSCTCVTSCISLDELHLAGSLQDEPSRIRHSRSPLGTFPVPASGTCCWFLLFVCLFVMNKQTLYHTPRLASPPYVTTRLLGCNIKRGGETRGMNNKDVYYKYTKLKTRNQQQIPEAGPERVPRGVRERRNRLDSS